MKSCCEGRGGSGSYFLSGLSLVIKVINLTNSSDMPSHPTMLYKSNCPTVSVQQISTLPRPSPPPSTPWWRFGSVAVARSLIPRPIMNLLHERLMVRDMFKVAALHTQTWVKCRGGAGVEKWAFTDKTVSGKNVVRLRESQTRRQTPFIGYWLSLRHKQHKGQRSTQS